MSNAPNDDEDLLADIELTEEVDASTPDEVENPLREMTDRPLPINVLTQGKNARELLDFFLTADVPSRGYNKTRISEESGISTNGIRRHIDMFVDFGLVEITTSPDAHTKRYAVKTQSEVYDALREVNEVLLNHYAEDRYN